MEKTLASQPPHTDEKTTVPQALHTSNAEGLPVMRVSADEKANVPQALHTDEKPKEQN